MSRPWIAGCRWIALVVCSSLLGCQPPQATVSSVAEEHHTVAAAAPADRLMDVSPPTSPALKMVVMDPLAEPLSCACVPGLGQRKYDDLAAFLAQKLARPVEMVADESLALAIDRIGSDVGLVIGKRSMVEFDAQATGTAVRPLARLSDSSGSTTVSGVILVRKEDGAQSVEDLRGRKLMLGPVEDAEVNHAVRQLLRGRGLEDEIQLAVAGSIDAAVFALTDKEADAAAVSQFLLPLLEACGKIEPGSLRVVGQTAPAPFVEVFATDAVSTPEADEIVRALRQVVEDAQLARRMESKRGFVSLEDETDETEVQDAAGKTSDDPAAGTAAVDEFWPNWRGPRRDGQSRFVPKSLPAELAAVWSADMTGPALAGIAATDRVVIAPDKDAEFKQDLFRCFDPRTGQSLWTLAYDAPDDVEYSNAPRATPVIHEGVAYLQGALGQLHCVDLATGNVIWRRHLGKDFQAEHPNWGYSASPTVVDDKLIVFPGGKEASVVALDRKTGEVVWKTPGHAAAYSTPLVGTFGGVRQLLGYDAAGLGGWDPTTGRRLWDMVPPRQSDFNVGTPVIVQGKVLVATENNGTRLYEFDDAGRLRPEPVATNQDLAPDTCTPVIVGRRMFCTAYGELYCLDVKEGLKTLWSQGDDVFFDHTNLIAGNDRVLIWTASADLLLVRADSDQYEELARLRPLVRKDNESMSFPALVQGRLYLRDGQQLKCFELPAE